MHLDSCTEERLFVGMVEIIRHGLLQRIESAHEPVVVVDAVAGMGKSVLVSQLASRLGTNVWRSDLPPSHDGPPDAVIWDVPPASVKIELDGDFLGSDRRIVIAKRPQTLIRGLNRAIVYGRVLRLDERDLCYSVDELTAAFGDAAAQTLSDRTAGWPFLVHLLSQGIHDEGDIVQFLMDEVLGTLSDGVFVDLCLALSGERPGSTQVRYLLADAVKEPLSKAVEQTLSRWISEARRAPGIAAAYSARGNETDAIVVLQRAGLHELALRSFSAYGTYFIYVFGPDAFDRVLDGFHAELAGQNETIVTSLALQALKKGDVPRARRLLADCYGSRANNVLKVLSDRAAFSATFRSFRLVMLIYEDIPLSDELLEQATALLSEFPLNAHLERGSIYNAILEFYIRRRRFEVALDLAARALSHYEQAGVALLSFYINLHQAMIHLMIGDAIRARRSAEEAAVKLARAPFHSSMDTRLLGLLEACVAYEDGKPEPLAQFLTTEMDEFSHGEVWATLIEFALQYGSQALSEHFSVNAARGFLDRWRIYQVYNRQFRLMIEVREAVILQNGNRWQQAADTLASIQSRINRTWVEAAVDELARLQDQDEIALAVVWLRHLVFDKPDRAHLGRQLAALANNLNLSGRQRLCIEVWQAFVARRQRDLTAARSILQKAFEKAARLGTVAPLSEERVFLHELTTDKRISDFLATMPTAQSILRRLRDAGFSGKKLGAESELTRREARLLLMIAEGASNKFIANALGLSEATVKFHLGNLYRKLGCNRRREAIEAAKGIGLIT
ncbi:LuxR C-terminal-related transcriptional regulator (plasmid) [Ensifer adhaerens]|uniref:LuxR family transcriptional regulator n=1 Tax=Ensifer adhaerens TaxID=106592 RepID=UPI0023A995D4|nr:LuxR family transcriptional regulator [Ensifer adhaerens]WDZ81438.1 LuxR C-terminal-related transcriptional regulator [Ensifer adhaerens]